MDTAPFWPRRLAVLSLALALWAAPAPGAQPGGPTAQALIKRHEREKSPVWADGDTATFFFRGEAEEVSLLLGGELKKLRRLPDSDVWTAAVERPGLAKGVFSYALVAHKKGESPFRRGERLHFSTWRGPDAPPAPAVARPLKGTEKTVEFPSKALGAKRAIRVYLPPGHDRARPAAVIYATDGQLDSELLEPLILAGKVRPVIVIGAASGGYLGERKPGEKHDVKKDLRAMEYLPGIDPARFASHEKFFCEELPAWAEREFGASRKREDRAVFGVSNGARFAVEMGLRHPDLFGHVFAFSVAGGSAIPAVAPGGPPHFHLAAGVWEKGFHKITSEVAEKLKKQSLPVDFHSRYSGHDDAMWRDELVAAVRRAFSR